MQKPSEISIDTVMVMDTETTGLDPKSGDRIVEIAAIEMVNKVLTGRHFHFYINPERDMPTAAYRIHGISGEFLKDKALFRDIADDFLNFIGSHPLVFHNAPFDVKFINHELSLLNRPSIQLLQHSNVIDTLPMARKMFPGMRASLDDLCKRFKVDNSSRQLHGALKDAALLAEVYVELTGGRQGSFNLEKEKNILTSMHINTNNINTITKTKLVKPTKEEMKKHKEFLTKILSPVWVN